MTRYEGKFKENCPDIMADKYKKYSKLVDATFALVLIGVIFFPLGVGILMLFHFLSKSGFGYYCNKLFV